MCCLICLSCCQLSDANYWILNVVGAWCYYKQMQLLLPHVLDKTSQLAIYRSVQVKEWTIHISNHIRMVPACMITTYLHHWNTRLHVHWYNILSYSVIGSISFCVELSFICSFNKEGSITNMKSLVWLGWDLNLGFLDTKWTL